jgi:ABC-type uncharacterized transport system substrate-binding protein
MNKKVIVIVFVVLFLIILFSIGFWMFKNNRGEDSNEISQSSSYSNKKVLYVNSYHKGFEWSDGLQLGIEDTLNEALVTFKSIYMDTKNNPSKEFGEEVALSVKDEINNYKPDVLIVSDDAAFKYLVSTYYKNTDLPIIFAGINWDLSAYGGQYTNTTGILEIALYKDIVSRLSKFSKGNKLAFLTGENISEHKNADFLKNNIDSNIKLVFVKNFLDWKKQFVEIQKNSDILIIGISAGIEDWDNIEAEKFVLENTKIPTGTEQSWMMPFSLLGYTKNPREQGEVSARMALDVLNGKTIREIPIVKNKKGDLFLNMKIANKLGLLIDNELLKNVTLVE